MKKQNKLSIKVRDLEPLKDVTGGRGHRRLLQVGAFRGEHCDGYRGLGPFGLNRPQ